MYNEFEKRDTIVIAVSNEERNIAQHANMLNLLKGAPKCKLAADIGDRKTKRYERTTAYLIDKEGIVRQVFPMEIYRRPPWWAILNEIDRVFGAR